MSDFARAQRPRSSVYGAFSQIARLGNYLRTCSIWLKNIETSRPVWRHRPRPSPLLLCVLHTTPNESVGILNICRTSACMVTTLCYRECGSASPRQCSGPGMSRGSVTGSQAQKLQVLPAFWWALTQQCPTHVWQQNWTVQPQIAARNSPWHVRHRCSRRRLP